MADLCTPPKGSSDDLVAAFQQRLGYTFTHPELLDRALTHPSSVVQDGLDNERMEFLGDAVLGLCIGQALYESHPHWTEGELTQVKSVAVSGVVLARVGEALGLREFSRLGRGLPRNEPLPARVYANIYEAVCAALYLDGGLPAACAFIHRTLGPAVEDLARNGHEANHKSALQQYAQRNGAGGVNYRLLAATGPDHEKLFEVAAVLGARAFPSATGRCKKDAEQAAARQALGILASEGVSLNGNSVNGRGTSSCESPRAPESPE